MEEQSEYYIEIKGELFLFRDIFENIEKERLMLAEKLYKKGISTQDYKEIMTRNSQIIDKVSKFFDTKRQFIDEFLKFKGSMEMAKSSWKHEREHFFKSKEQ
ncbi:hypothetical protein HYU50_01855 [Candidatus Woesearchaeota archaeon]|nr:hypothetical protein [Candidatus Woesearchaeota archaeon]